MLEVLEGKNREKRAEIIMEEMKDYPKRTYIASLKGSFENSAL